MTDFSKKPQKRDKCCVSFSNQDKYFKKSQHASAKNPV